MRFYDCMKILNGYTGQICKITYVNLRTFDPITPAKHCYVLCIKPVYEVFFIARTTPKKGLTYFA